MNDVAALIADMVRAGVDPEIIGRTAATIAGIDKADPKSARQQRNARYYQRKTSEKRLNSDDQDVSDAGSPSPKEKSPKPPKEITPTTVSEARASSTQTRGDFDAFWSLFPNKVGKRDAEREFAAALKRASFADIMAGLQRYVGKTDDRPWCNPTTFLHQDRWSDQPAAAPPRGHGPPGNRKPNAVDAMQQIFQERGWNSEPEILRSSNSDDQRVPAEHGGYSGAVVDLRPGAFRRVRSGD